jgi:phosphatidylinositol alpha-1,6-mannosyltransferase
MMPNATQAKIGTDSLQTASVGAAVAAIRERQDNSADPPFAHQAGAPRKILFLADCFLPHAGGSRVYYFNLYSRLAATYGEHVTVLTKKVPGWQEFDARESRKDLRIIRRFQPLPDLTLKHLPKIVLPLAEAAGRALVGRTDVVHSGDFYPQGAIAILLKQSFGIPYLAYCHGEDITLTERYRHQRLLRNRLYRDADAVVAACEFARQSLLGIGISEERIVKITPGVDWERFAPRPRSEKLVRQFGLEDRRVLMTVARLTPRKGHATVLRAFARILPQVPNTTYLIVGSGAEREKLERLAAELGIWHAVRFAGYVPEQDLADFYNLCDLFVMMNQESDGDIEGFGMVFLEASAAGKPVIGGRSGGTEDSILQGQTGFLVDPEDISELAASLLSLLESQELRERLGAAGRARAREDFSWSTRAERLCELNRTIAGGLPNGPRAAIPRATSKSV